MVETESYGGEIYIKMKNYNDNINELNFQIEIYKNKDKLLLLFILLAYIFESYSINKLFNVL